MGDQARGGGDSGPLVALGGVAVVPTATASPDTRRSSAGTPQCAIALTQDGAVRHVPDMSPPPQGSPCSGRAFAASSWQLPWLGESLSPGRMALGAALASDGAWLSADSCVDVHAAPTLPTDSWAIANRARMPDARWMFTMERWHQDQSGGVREAHPACQQMPDSRDRFVPVVCPR